MGVGVTPSGGSTPESPNPAKQEESGNPLFILLPVFVLLFLLIRFRVDSSLVYLKGPGLFVLDLGFLRQFLDYPGRPARYVTLFLQEFYWFPTVGALVASGLVTLSSLLAYSLFARTAPKSDGFARTLGGWLAILLPALGMTVAYSRYQPVDMVGIDAALLLALLYTTVFRRSPIPRAGVYVGLLVLLALFSPEMCPLMASLCALWELAGHGRCRTAFVYSLLGALPLGLLHSYVYHQGTELVMSQLAPLLTSERTATGLAVLAVLLGLHLAVAWRRRSKAVLFAGLVVVVLGLQFDFPGSLQGLLCLAIVLVPTTCWLVAGGGAGRAWNLEKEAGRYALAGLSAFALLLAFLSLDRQERCYLGMLKNCRDRDWAGTLDLARQLEPTTYTRHPSCYSMVQRALYHLGRLPWDLLLYPIEPSSMAPAPLPRRSGGLGELNVDDVAEMCLDLGLVNHAELMACNVQDSDEMPARACQLLVMVYTAKRNREAAKPLLGLLRKSISQRQWAERFSAWLGGARDEEIQNRIREITDNMVPSERAADTPTLVALRIEGWYWDLVYQRLLSVNGHNRMAFEYLMAEYLLSCRPDRIVASLPQYRVLGYPRIPSLYQEAILIDYFRTGEFPEDVAPEEMDEALTSTYQKLLAVYRQHGLDPAATLAAIQNRYGSTYFAYYLWSMVHAPAQE